MGTSKRDGFYKRGKVWWTRDPVTKQRCSTHSTDLEAARRWRAARERIAADPAHAAAQTSRLGEWISRWLTMKAAKASDATMSVARQKLGHWVRLVGADELLVNLTPGAFDRYVTIRRGEDVGDHTISKEVTHILSVLRLAKRGGCYPLDLETLRPPDLHANYVPRKRALTRLELAALLSELEPRRGALVAVCVALGCRLSEAHRLLPTDFAGDVVTIRGKKSEGAYRTLPILPFYRPLLKQAMPWLPLEPWGKVWRDLGAACRRARIDRCTPNDLRRTHATLMVEAGVDHDVVRRLLGHTSTAMVDRVYGQPKPEALGKLADAKLRDAEPIPEVHGRHSRKKSDAKKAKAPVAQRIEQRFPKPGLIGAETSSTEPIAGFLGAYSPAEDAGLPWDPLGAGTRTSQPPDGIELPLPVWALAETALRLGVLRTEARRA